MKRLLTLFVFVAALASTVFAGAQSEGKTNSNGQAQNTVKSLSEMTWKDVVAQAKQEGTVVWYQWYFQPKFREFTQKFTEEYGIKVVVTDGTHDSNINKFLADRNKKTGDIDVLSIAGADIHRFDMPKSFIGPLTKLIPGGGKLRTKIEGGNSQGYAVAFWGNQVGIAYNPSTIKQSELPQTVEQMSAWLKAHPQRFGFNISNGGSGPGFVEGITRNLVNDVNFSDGTSTPEKVKKMAPVWKWFNDRKAEYVITASNADSLTRLNDGEFDMVPAFEDMLANLQKSNTISNKFKIYVPAFGMPGGGNVVGISANAPHKAASLLFIQWLTSAEVQVELNAMFGSAPQNPDAHSDKMLISMAQRAYSKDWIAKPFATDAQTAFSDNVVMK
jgi:putative spermidine/putrescine transport system substrate-binding protein